MDATTLGALCCAGGYFVGGIPTGVILAKLFSDVDPREVGSGNIGATNITRAMGRKWGIITFLGDALKGAVVLALTRYLTGAPEWTAAVGVIAVLGHIFSIFLKFRGGKGVATSMGVVIAASPVAAVMTVPLWVAPYLLTRTSSIGGLVWAVGTPVVMHFATHIPAYTAMSAALAIIILVSHHDNIRRLMSGEEMSFSSSPENKTE